MLAANRRTGGTLDIEAVRTISKRTQYGLKAVMSLGEKYRTGPVLISALANEHAIPIKFLEAILLDLKSKGILESRVGRNGGYYLGRPPSAITIGSLVRVLEGPLAPLPCASETAYRACEECVDVESCGTRIIMRRVRDAIADVLDRTTVADLIAQIKEKRARPVLEVLSYDI